MPSRLEIALQDQLADPEGEGIRKKARAYFGI
jgi:phosphoribosylformylglycinamidine (FGAM) synthase PurS component